MLMAGMRITFPELKPPLALLWGRMGKIYNIAECGPVGEYWMEPREPSTTRTPDPLQACGV